MRSDVAVIACVRSQNLVQMHLAQDNDVVHTLTSDRPDQPFGKAIGIGLDSISYGTHSMRRTKATQIYRKTGNLRAVQLLLGHTKLESTGVISGLK